MVLTEDETAAAGALVERLTAEHCRTGALPMDRVLAVCERRHVSPAVMSAVRTRLSADGILKLGSADAIAGWMPPDDDDAFFGARIDILGQYLDELARHPLLMAEDEVLLGRRIRAARERFTELLVDSPDNHSTEVELGDLQKHFLRSAAKTLTLVEADRRLLLDGADAEDRLYLCNLRLVVSVARTRYWNHAKLAPLDIIQAGNLGLVRAVQKFDHRMGYKFSTYATWWIRQAIDRYVADNGRTVRLPVHIINLIGGVRRARSDLYTELGREPSLGEVADWTELDPGRVQFLLDVDRPTRSLDVPVGEDGGTTLGDLLEDRNAADPSDVATGHIRREAILDVLEELNERERQVVQMRFGINSRGRVHTLEEIGRVFGVTRERIRQIEAKTLTKLRDPERSRKLREHFEGDVVRRRDESAHTSGEDRMDAVIAYAVSLNDEAGDYVIELAGALMGEQDTPDTPVGSWAGEVHARVVHMMERA